MKHIRTLTPDSKLNLPDYSISKKKDREKSCFINSNRKDRIKAAQEARKKRRAEFLSENGGKLI